MRQIMKMTMKHGEIIQRIQELEKNIAELKEHQKSLMRKTRQLEKVSEYALMAKQVRGVRTYLHWRQRYYKRPFFKLEDERGRHMLNLFPTMREKILDIENERIQINYQYLVAISEYEQLVQLNNNLKTWRKLRDDL